MSRLLLLLLFFISIASAKPQVKAAVDNVLTLEILHVNDIHAHFEEVNELLGRCKPTEVEVNACYGGAARMATKAKEVRAKEGNVIFLNAGDYYQGSMWHTLFGYEAMLEMGNLMNYTALGLGNHDFDDGIDGLVPLVDGANFGILAANIEESGEQVLMSQVKRSQVQEFQGVKVGLVGYVTQDAQYTFELDHTLSFSAVIDSVREEAATLKAEGVDIIIALGHNGYTQDLIMAEQVPDVDIVVGGHSHTFLYTGTPPSIEKPEGPYPTYITQASGKVVPVVQAYLYSKYMGHLTVSFDVATGDLLSPVDGAGVERAEVVLLDRYIAKDVWVDAAMDKYREQMMEYYKEIGFSLVDLLRGTRDGIYQMF